MRARLLTGGLLLAILMAAPSAVHAQDDMSVSFDLDAPPPVAIAPPALPVYVVPPPPEDYGYIWSPGYWAWDGYDYFWVPGTWVTPPVVGYLWTPGYWGWYDGAYLWHTGYWGRHVGFYGGINYGGGYDGVGFHGGHWRGGRYSVDRARLNVTLGGTGSRVSFNGGAGGIRMQATAAQIAVARAPHTAPTAQQISHIRDASTDRALENRENHGAPPVAATARPGDFSHGFAARGAGPVNKAAERYNAQVLQNPAAHHAVMPQARPAGVEQPRGATPQQERREVPQNTSRSSFNPGGPGPASFNPGGAGQNFDPSGAEQRMRLQQQQTEQLRSGQQQIQQERSQQEQQIQQQRQQIEQQRTQQRIEQPAAPAQPRIEQPHIEQPRPAQIQQPHVEAPHEEQHQETPAFNPGGGANPGFNPGGSGGEHGDRR